MKIESVKQQVLSIAKLNPNGFTFNPIRESLTKRGYAVATKKTQDCLGGRGLHKVVKFVLRNCNYCIGGWRNEDGVLQFDASRIYFDLKEAIDFAIKNEQRAIFNLYTGKVIEANEYERYIEREKNAA